VTQFNNEAQYWNSIPQASIFINGASEKESAQPLISKHAFSDGQREAGVLWKKENVSQGDSPFFLCHAMNTGFKMMNAG